MTASFFMVSSRLLSLVSVIDKRCAPAAPPPTLALLLCR
jgi:hypothetical protein